MSWIYFLLHLISCVRIIIPLLLSFLYKNNFTIKRINYLSKTLIIALVVIDNISHATNYNIYDVSNKYSYESSIADFQLSIVVNCESKQNSKKSQECDFDGY